MSDQTQDRELLKRAVRLFHSLIDNACGNSEGTPCDDRHPGYICPLHKWLREARKALR